MWEAQCGRPGYLAWFKFPVVNDTGGDDGSVIPVACAAVVLACVVTLPCLTRNTPYRTGQDMKPTKHDDSVLHCCFEVTTLIHLTAAPTPSETCYKSKWITVWLRDT